MMSVTEQPGGRCGPGAFGLPV